MKMQIDSIDAVAPGATPHGQDALPLAISVAIVLAVLATASLSLDYCLACL